MSRESGTDVCTLPGVKWAAGGKRPVATRCSGMPERDGAGWGGGAPREGMYVHTWLSPAVQRNTHCKAAMLQF